MKKQCPFEVIGIKKGLNSLKTSFLHVIIGEKLSINERLESVDNLYLINGNKCKSKCSALKEFAEALSFPDYFGHNWDAFDECINDLDWLDDCAFIIFIYNTECILKRQRSDFKVLISILGNAVDEWINGRSYNPSFPTKPTPFHIVFHFEKEHSRIKRIEGILNRKLNKLSVAGSK